MNKSDDVRPSRRTFLTGTGALAAAAVAPSVAASPASAAPAGSTAQETPDHVYRVDGLSGPAEIRVDSAGVPHIAAEHHYDAFFAQGFNAARDRLFQIDLWRKRGLGRLAASFGPAFVDQDAANRRFMYRGSMSQEWLAYGNDAQRIAESYAAGINAYIAAAEQDTSLLPWEFEFLGYSPERWEPEDVVRVRSHAIAGNLTGEVERAYFVRDFGFQYEDIRSPLAAGWQTAIPEGLNLDLLPDDPDELLSVYLLATADVELREEDLEAVEFGSPTLRGHTVQRGETASNAPDAADEGRGDGSGTGSPYRRPNEGSNTWAVAPQHTATEGPLIASDPHRGQGVPSLRYIAHLNAPGMNVIGAGEPGLPGVSLGHNENIAFGLTIFDIDQEDLYVYETNPENPTEYRYQGRWIPMEIEEAEIEVRGGDPVVVALKFTRHGPVIYEDEERHVAFAVRTAWSAPGTGAYFGSVEYMRAQNWDEFLAAMNRWGAPGENQQYADVEGNIGWKPGGKTPVRENWDGLLPVPGDGRYEWDGFYSMDKLPVNVNPDRGWLQTNNEMRLFDDFENGPQDEYVQRKIGFEALQTARATRTRELLADVQDATVQSMNELWRDRLSIPARSIIGELDAIATDDQDVQQAIALLRNWDYQMGNDSAAAALFDVWTALHGAPGVGAGFLGQALVSAVVDDAEAVERIGVPDETVVPEMVANPEDWFTGDVVAKRDQAVVTSLRHAVDKLTEDQGDDPGQWRYGAYNQQELRHALSDLVDFRTRRQIDIGPRERFVVNNTIADEGASWRYIAEAGNWDQAVAMNNPGQSGDPESPYYDNLFASWAAGETFPLHFSDEAVRDNTEVLIWLRPS